MIATPVRFAPRTSERPRLLRWARRFRLLYGRWPDYYGTLDLRPMIGRLANAS